MMTRRKSDCLNIVLTLAALLTLPFPAPARAAQEYSIPLTFEDRVHFGTAIEQVYWNHRIWPEENTTPKPPLEAVLPEASIRGKVEDYLKKSNALEIYWKMPVTAQQLQAEMDRIARETEKPDVLLELFAALHNDPYLIAECLARPILADRIIHNMYAGDERFHGALKRQIESELTTTNTVDAMRALSGSYRESFLKRDVEGSYARGRDRDGSISLEAQEWNEFTDRLQRQLAGLPVLTVSRLHEEADRFFVVAILQKDDASLRLATVEWREPSFEGWWSNAKSQTRAEATTPSSVYLLSNGRSPATTNPDDTWSSTNTANAPTGRYLHAAVWTGTEMIVWGGFDGVGTVLNTGGRYNPVTNSWAPGGTGTSGAPTARQEPTAIWTGTEMVVWGGYDSNNLNTGGRYNPSTDSWAAGGTSATNAPTGRTDHAAVWTGTEMIVWGGFDGLAPYVNTGGRYNPASNTWAAGGTSASNAPSGRYLHVWVWTGVEMIVWGGWDGAHLVNTGGRYNPATNTWAAGGTNTSNAPTVRYEEGATWTGTEMIVWGGFDGVNYFNTGGRYNPTTNSWAAGGTSTTNAPTARRVHGPVWTGTEMIVWGGFDSVQLVNTGGRYNPATNSWNATSTTNAPSARTAHTGVWTGGDMIVWGGVSNLNTGGVYGAGAGSSDVESPAEGTGTKLSHLALAPPSPNPTTAGITLAYGLLADGDVRLSVHDVSGREVARLLDGRSPAGWHSIAWNGNGSGGHRVAAGVYFVRATGVGETRVQRMIVIR